MGLYQKYTSTKPVLSEVEVRSVTNSCVYK